MLEYKLDSMLRAAGLGALILAGSAASAATVTVNFDQLPDGRPFIAPTAFFQTNPVRGEFAGFGVHFLVPTGVSGVIGGGGVLSGNFGLPHTSGTNFMAFTGNPSAVYQNRTNPLPPQVILFDQPTNLVRLQIAGFGGTATLTTFDAARGVVGRASVNLGTTPVPLEVQSNSYNIVSANLEISGIRGAVADDLVFAFQDRVNVPPVTSCALSGQAGNSGWYLGNVQATLTAQDEDGTVSETRWRLDGGGWQTYIDPVLVSGDGSHTLEYQSRDSEGAWEEVKATTFKIDSQKPALEMCLSRWYLWPANGKDFPVTVNGAARDGGSGLTGVTFEVKDEYGQVQPLLTAFGQTVALKAAVKPRDPDGRFYRVTATAADHAGNQCRVVRWVLVPHRWLFCHAEYAKLTRSKSLGK